MGIHALAHLDREAGSFPAARWGNRVFTGPALFPLYPNVLLVCPMSGWLQTHVNKLATARCGRYVLISFPLN